MDKYEMAHKYSINNRPQLLKDNVCGCFYCLEIFNPNIIQEWVEDTDVPIGDVHFLVPIGDVHFLASF